MEQLDIQDLAFERDNFELRASLVLERGQIGVLLGPSGSGKTTLLRLIAGLEQASSGKIYLGGRRIDQLPPEKRGLSFMFQDLALFDHLSGWNNLAFGLRQHHVSEQEIAQQTRKLADKFQIFDLLSKKPQAMSGGERQRLALARALAVNPELLLLDEPFSSLDAPLRRELRGYIRLRLKENGTTSLHVTHDVEEAMDLGDVLFLMRKGRIVAQGMPKEICAGPPDAWCVSFLGLGWLLPADSIDSQGQTARVFCGKQVFVIPKNHCKVQKDASERTFLFCSQEGLALQSEGKLHDKSLTENLPAPWQGNLLEGRIQRIIEGRNRKRIIIDTRSLGLTGDLKGPDGFLLPFELTAPEGFCGKEGDWIGVRLASAQCWALPTNA